jgi:hypothetical protein
MVSKYPERGRIVSGTDDIVQLDDQDIRCIDAAIKALDRPIQDKLEPVIK